jgi:hypothetical protein
MENGTNTPEKQGDCTRSSAGQSNGFLIQHREAVNRDSELETRVGGVTEADQADELYALVALLQPAIGQRFAEKYWINPKTGCWQWLAGIDRYGYGIFTINTRNKKAHRVAYAIHRGPIPAGQVLDHLCRNRACVNPAHLEAVRHGDNIRRGRRAKLTWDQVREIRRLSEGGFSIDDLATRFSVSYSAVQFILTNRSWIESGEPTPQTLALRKIRRALSPAGGEE